MKEEKKEIEDDKKLSKKKRNKNLFVFNYVGYLGYLNDGGEWSHFFFFSNKTKNFLKPKRSAKRHFREWKIILSAFPICLGIAKENFLIRPSWILSFFCFDFFFFCCLFFFFLLFVDFLGKRVGLC